MSKKFKNGDLVNYHAIQGGPVTSTGHKIVSISYMPNNFGCDIAWLNNKSGCVSLNHLSLSKTEGDGSWKWKESHAEAQRRREEQDYIVDANKKVGE